MSDKKRLGELLIDAGLLTTEQCNKALKMQVGGNRRLGRILVKMGAVSSDQLLEVLSSQFAQPIIDIGREMSPGVQGVLPRYLCKKYEVFPLAKDEPNILKVAMADPSDMEAINDIETYTGYAVQPCLARQSDIQQSIKQHIRFSFRDIFNPQTYTRYTKIASAAALGLTLIVAGLTYQVYTQVKYGTITRTADAVLFKNHDLMIGFEQSGKVTLLGRGSHATGYYSITFESRDPLAQFITSKKNDLSSDQYEWAQWVLAQKMQ